MHGTEGGELDRLMPYKSLSVSEATNIAKCASNFGIEGLIEILQ